MKCFTLIVLVTVSLLQSVLCYSQQSIHDLVAKKAIQEVERIVGARGIYKVGTLELRQYEKPFWYMVLICNETATFTQKNNACPYIVELSNEDVPRVQKIYQNLF